ncbi:DNA helicase UvrD [Candidatus Desantisbacteria bacterium CG_4_10_14_0_8_um_filter_48_22]|uniref:DNA helicase UvrD n=1 Tax=Candidatus Desantisbacteria bacterium CG_4_10_14_0_8_um_filter_48_22 TaxID=1974543 RepID=A0A2M7SEJ7_9BACT|nr:MAG: DNA helicase UvrD [Candidatus Desantisbacteria bacterium CG1_02_49_89]PIV54933.1 MAG: DNA helicase UvrD [Candidatus Desantisbacteria bacterium CG02_land_8_20_14_3_00_49_13]PIZ17733.1 MAG: DNA helicase UvrD [Candidatus Desantisbacteria bacterium CG_4_10_14_0_8_um_filter_48_22]
MEFIADLHVHSKYSRATSRQMDIAGISKWAKLKGIKLMATGDFTHPDWLAEMQRELEPAGYGLYKKGDIYFVLTAEVCNNFYKEGKNHRIHTLVLAPSFDAVKKINRDLEKYGNLESDGRPILDISAKDLVKSALNASADCLIIPGHIWTPWFSLFGANTGFDKIEECFEDQTRNIFGLETGLSSDPIMNWRLSALDRYTLLSNSDSHSPKKIGREANVFDCGLDYREITDVIRKKDKSRFLYTIEFFPEEGKYHYDGHRLCNVVFAPEETRKHNYICPGCGKRLTVGVMHRVEKLADREAGFVPPNAIPYKNLIPLDEIIADALGVGKESVLVEREYMALVSKAGTEFDILLKMTDMEIRKNIPQRIAENIINMRQGRVKASPGYDGVYGKIEVLKGETKEAEQLSLF